MGKKKEEGLHQSAKKWWGNKPESRRSKST